MSDRHRTVSGTALGLCAVLASLLGATGCAFVGPAALRSGRAAYNETIVATNNEQVLGMIVRMRYGEPAGLLAVSSITANMKLQSNAGAEFGFGSDTNYQGNLVPLSIGLAYEENPTISYTPVQGEKYMRQILSPLPIDLTLLILHSLRHSPLGTTLLLRSINGIRNPDFVVDADLEADSRFARVGELLAELGREGGLSWVQGSAAGAPLALTLALDRARLVPRIQELHDLLGLAPPQDRAGLVTLPVEAGLGVPDEPAIRLETRSLYDLLHVAAASVEVPEEHLRSGIAPPLPAAGLAGRSIRIRRTKRRPDDALAAVRHHGGWYSIDASDATSKLVFRIVESLISVRIADSVDHPKATPVLTVPVAR